MTWSPSARWSRRSSIGVVPQEDAFVGFGHHATVIIALVLIVSRGLSNSGAIELIAQRVIGAGRSLFMHISVMSGVSAVPVGGDEQRRRAGVC